MRKGWKRHPPKLCGGDIADDPAEGALNINSF